MGRDVNVFLQYWALDAFRADRVRKDHGVSADAVGGGAAAMAAHAPPHWSDLFVQAKELGTVEINACADSMEMFGLTTEDLDPLVDGVTGVAAFFGAAGDGQIIFV
jgi:peroxiredoxin family protein